MQYAYIVFAALCFFGYTYSKENVKGDVVPHQKADQLGKSKRVFSLFTVVRFEEYTCNASNSQGICTTSLKCTQEGGTEIGTCAEGWGVCCEITKATCGSTVSKNCTFIQNPSYPSSESGSQTCCYTINKCTDNICWLKLDMERNTLADQTVTTADNTINGMCQVDTMTTSCSTGTRFPANFCGANDGQHAFLDVCLVDSCEICFNLGSGTNTRIWRIKITQIECDSPWRPPDGCLQYYKENTGTFCNFGFQDTDITHLSDQYYSICIRMNKNKCSITYAASTSFTNSFRISPPDLVSNVGGGCGGEMVIIPRAVGVTGVDRTIFCGQRLNSLDDNAANSPVTSFAKPFTIQYFAGTNENPVDENGFCLDYSQNDC